MEGTVCSIIAQTIVVALIFISSKGTVNMTKSLHSSHFILYIVMGPLDC